MKFQAIERKGKRGAAEEGRKALPPLQTGLLGLPQATRPATPTGLPRGLRPRRTRPPLVGARVQAAEPPPRCSLTGVRSSVGLSWGGSPDPASRSSTGILGVSRPGQTPHQARPRVGRGPGGAPGTCCTLPHPRVPRGPEPGAAGVGHAGVLLRQSWVGPGGDTRVLPPRLPVLSLSSGSNGGVSPRDAPGAALTPRASSAQHRPRSHRLAFASSSP